MPAYVIRYFAGNNEMGTVEIEAPTAADALVMFDVNVAGKRRNRTSAGPMVGDVASIKMAIEKGFAPRTP